MDKLKETLSRLNLILEKSKIKRQDSAQRGEQFNIFHICGIEHYETSHSTILAGILNPNGNHGQGDTFLKAFLESVSIQYGYLSLIRKQPLLKQNTTPAMGALTF